VEDDADAIWREFMEVWLSCSMMEVISLPQAEREEGPGARGGGEMRIPWAEARGKRGRRKGRRCIL
jgi:hypothetical protein